MKNLYIVTKKPKQMYSDLFTQVVIIEAFSAAAAVKNAVFEGIIEEYYQTTKALPLALGKSYKYKS